MLDPLSFDPFEYSEDFEFFDFNQFNQFKTELFGKNGAISDLFKKLGLMSSEDRKKFASDLNFIKEELQEHYLIFYLII